MTYHEPEDLKRATKLVSPAPPEAQAWLKFDHSIERQDGQISRKYRELMAVAALLTVQCAVSRRQSGVTGWMAFHA